MAPETQGRIIFGEFELDLESLELWRNGSRVKLAPQPARVLGLLASSPGRLISRDEVRQRLWGPDTYVDFEHGLNFCIREIRAALQDSAQKPGFVETLPRRGYRFIAPISRSEPAKAREIPSRVNQAEAYEHYARARENLTKLDVASLTQARADFEQAILLDPAYAMAHSGLGATLSMILVNRSDRGDREKAKFHLERALELDPELAEPYSWLCYINIRSSDVDGAIRAGHRAVTLLPHLVQAHYFLGLAYYVAAERQSSNYQSAIDHLLNATKAGPRWAASWFVLSYTALANGEYVHATEYANQLGGQGPQPGSVPFIGSELILAVVKMRQGSSEDAAGLLQEFLARLELSGHMYRNSMLVTGSCLLGEVELRRDNPANALAAYRRGWHVVQEHTQMLAHQRLSSRVQSGLAAAYATLGERDRAAELLQKALALVRESHESEHNAAGASLGELYYSLATAFHRQQDPANTISMLESAVDAGWLDANWFTKDGEWQSLHGESRFRKLVDRLESVPKLKFNLD